MMNTARFDGKRMRLEEVEKMEHGYSSNDPVQVLGELSQMNKTRMALLRDDCVIRSLSVPYDPSLIKPNSVLGLFCRRAAFSIWHDPEHLCSHRNDFHNKVPTMDGHFGTSLPFTHSFVGLVSAGGCYFHSQVHNRHLSQLLVCFCTTINHQEFCIQVSGTPDGAKIGLVA